MWPARRADLDALVRPAADGFLRSRPTKDELLDQVAGIRRRQRGRPAWIPRIGRDGNPLSASGTGSSCDEPVPDRALRVTARAELGDVAVMLPGAGEDRPEPAMAPGGIGEWESALYTVPGPTGPHALDATVTLDAEADAALVPEGVRRWALEPPRPALACEDPGVAGELLATSAALGGLAVAEGALEAFEAVAVALVGAGDRRYGPRWLLEPWSPGEGAATLATARAAIAGWADEDRGGLILYV